MQKNLNEVKQQADKARAQHTRVLSEAITCTNLWSKTSQAAGSSISKIVDQTSVLEKSVCNSSLL